MNAEKRILSPTENDIWETAKAIHRLYVNKIAPQTKLITLRTDALQSRGFPLNKKIHSSLPMTLTIF